MYLWYSCSIIVHDVLPISVTTTVPANSNRTPIVTDNELNWWPTRLTPHHFTRDFVSRPVKSGSRHLQLWSLPVHPVPVILGFTVHLIINVWRPRNGLPYILYGQVWSRNGIHVQSQLKLAVLAKSMKRDIQPHPTTVLLWIQQISHALDHFCDFDHRYYTT